MFAHYNHNKDTANKPHGIIVDSAFLTPGRQTPVMFQPIDRPCDPLAGTVNGPIKGAGPVFMLLARAGDMDMSIALCLTGVGAPTAPDVYGLRAFISHLGEFIYPILLVRVFGPSRSVP